MGGMMFKTIVMVTRARLIYQLEKEVWKQSEFILQDVIEVTGASPEKAVEYALHSRDVIKKYGPEL